MPEIVLHGCTPEPLMSYLKALGILRLVAEQADCEVRGAWRGGVFVVSSGFDEDALIQIFSRRIQTDTDCGAMEWQRFSASLVRAIGASLRRHRSKC